MGELAKGPEACKDTVAAAAMKAAGSAAGWVVALAVVLSEDGDAGLLVGLVAAELVVVAFVAEAAVARLPGIAAVVHSIVAIAVLALFVVAAAVVVGPASFVVPAGAAIVAAAAFAGAFATAAVVVASACAFGAVAEEETLAEEEKLTFQLKNPHSC